MNFSSYIQHQNQDISADQLEKIKESEEYIQKHRLDILFNELLAQIIWKQPDDIKDALKKELELVKANRGAETFFSKKDFEILFDNYDVSKQGAIKFKYMLMAFEAIGIHYSAEKYKAEFNKDINGETLISKLHFLDVISAEYRKELIGQ